MNTVGQWLQATADLPRLDRELLLNQLLGTSRAQLLAHPERQLQDQQLQHLAQRLRQLRDGVPTAYILGQQEFWGLPFKVSPAVLIPRPETELLVERAAACAPQGATVLDLGTGSGAIAVALAHSRADLSVTAVDCSAEALMLARHNATVNGVNVNFIRSDWFAELHGQWQVIISNPPYIAEQDPHLPALRHEPQTALVSGSQGLCDLQHIISQAPAFLQSQGHLLLEHGYDQAAAVHQFYQQGGWYNIHNSKDLAGIARVTQAQWQNHGASAAREQT